MGMGVSVATAVIFIGVILSAGSLISTLDDAQSSWMDVKKAVQDRDMMATQTDIAIKTIDRNNGTVELLNQGSSTLNIRDMDILLDGRWSNDLISSMGVAGHEGSNILLPGETLIIRFAFSLEDADVKIVTGNGISAYH